METTTAPFTVKLSKYARYGFEALRATEEALKDDMWGPKGADSQRDRGSAANRYVSPQLLSDKDPYHPNQPCPTIFVLQCLPHIADLPSDPWAKNQPTAAEVAERISKATGIRFEIEE